MSERPKSSTTAVLKQSVLTIQNLRRQLESERTASREPVAVVGLACRFPGGCDTPERFWEFLTEGGIGVREVPEDRWSVEETYDPSRSQPGTMYVRQSNFLDRDVASFDARFFKISPLEANAMDPQQRQLLEVCWEALENAGQHPEELRGSTTGVFLGISSNSEYAQLVRDSADVNEYIGTGTTSSIASGRVSYAFGWNGPALSVDTACSSSLVGPQLAVDALRRGDCDMALAGGVNMMLAPGVMASLCAMNALAPDGRSKPFDATADGYGRGEGVGMVVLKRLADARRDGDTVYAVIRGGAVNNDGESSGLTMPNGRAQRAVLARALANAGVAAEQVDYLETHGTGTLLGDPIEIDAIHQVYGHPSRRLTLGALKANIGHLEAGAGIASLIKTVLCLHHGQIPPIAGLGELNPRIAPVSDSFVFPRSTQSWPALPDRPRHAAVSSFGFSGTNAHLVLAEAPAAAPEPAAGPARPALTASLLTLTATDEEKLVRQIRRFDEHLARHPEVPVEDLCFTANACRTAFAHRAVFLGGSAAELRDGFRAVMDAHEKEGSLYSDTSVILGSSHGRDRWNARRTLYTTHAGGRAYAALTDEKIQPKLAFLFPGAAGDDAAGTFATARALARLFPVFQDALTECLAHFDGAPHGPQAAAFAADGGTPATPQAAENWLFAAEYALSRLLAAYRVAPEITFGERTGSLVAAVVSGVLDLADAARHQLARQAVAATGEPVAFARVLLAGEVFDGVLRDWSGHVHQSAVYGPAERVISGAPDALELVTEALAEAGAEIVPEPAGGWPSAAYQGREAAWRAAVEGADYREPGSRYQSPHSLRAEHRPAALRADFQDNALTAPIRYDAGLAELYEQGYRFFVELGAPRAAEVLERDDVVVLRPAADADALEGLLRVLARLLCLGSALDWRTHYAAQGRRKVMLPNFPFEPTRHWLAHSAEEPDADGLTARLRREGLHREELNLPIRQKQYRYTFAHRNFPELVDNSGVVHVGYYLEMLRGVLVERHGDRPSRVRGMRFATPIMVFAEETKEVLLVLDPSEDTPGAFDFQFHSKAVDADHWSLNVSGTVEPADGTGGGGPGRLDVAGAREGGRHVPREEFYEPLEADRGFYFGPAVRFVDDAWWRAEHEVLVGFAEAEGETGRRSYALGFHPGVLDSCAQTCNYVVVEHTPKGQKYMVAELDDVLLRPRSGSGRLFASVAMPGYDAERGEITGRIRLVEESGATVVSVGHIRLKEFDERKLGELKAMMDAATLEKDAEDRDFLQRYGQANAERKRELLLEYLSRLLAHVLELEPDEIGPDQEMGDFGLDSMTGLRFFNRTGTLLGLDISFADLVQSDTLRGLADHLTDLLPGGTGTQREAQTKPYDGDLTPGHWIYRHDPAPKPAARVRLFCFPNGYRNADLFDEWQDILGPEIDVCAVMLPGMDTNRLDELPPTDLDAFMETMERVIDPALLDLPCATFGHSWGALFSFRLAHRLNHNANARLVRTFVSGFAAPSVPNPSIQDILDEVVKHGMTRIPTYEEIRHDPEAVDMVVRAYGDAWSYGEVETRATLPQLLAACSLIDRYTYDPEETFSAPVTAFHGVDDWVASAETKLWEGLTTGPFALHTMAGDHQFIDANQSQRRLLALIREELLDGVDPS
ncbi:beta-ketoacyl synthase N-terminal-like domain-containing protein [Streptomyces sp. DSM 44915]|uniref:Beta-ketoacyl synthase N-terminal-like domain-containing protein n=1 Tax=Streptomyces chisholmiae TaxID=3075540 RepID=A0ABU2JUD3_9ACTN|nr:polyketide synthase [Streptomyces sp. DSM 44915]MDT0268348.1 beta-ketoacyl synthase N-terminal-like domain-containing protein [Streptomyces sp. DSM 44915]UZD11010.1 polyketide synthase [Marinispora sp. CNQ-140]